MFRLVSNTSETRIIDGLLGVAWAGGKPSGAIIGSLKAAETGAGGKKGELETNSGTNCGLRALVRGG